SRRRHTRFDCDWSSDVCSSDLASPKAARSASSSTWKHCSKSSCVFTAYCLLLYGNASTLTKKRNVPPLATPSRNCTLMTPPLARSEERRVGKERRAWGWGGQTD